jgi:hypothetical protein
MEQSSSRVKWFGEDGRLVALPDPILKRPTRPPNLDDSDTIVEPDTYFCPPFFGVQSATDDLSFGKISGQAHCQLDVRSCFLSYHLQINRAIEYSKKCTHTYRYKQNVYVFICISIYC